MRSPDILNRVDMGPFHFVEDFDVEVFEAFASANLSGSFVATLSLDEIDSPRALCEKLSGQLGTRIFTRLDPIVDTVEDLSETESGFVLLVKHYSSERVSIAENIIEMMQYGWKYWYSAKKPFHIVFLKS